MHSPQPELQARRRGISGCGGADLCIFQRVSLGVPVFLGICGFAVGEVGVWEERDMDGVVFDRVRQLYACRVNLVGAGVGVSEGGW